MAMRNCRCHTPRRARSASSLCSGFATSRRRQLSISGRLVAPLVVHCAAGISRSTAIAMIPLIAYYESVHLAARRLYQIREFAQPNTHVLYLTHQTLSLEENIYEILFQAQNPGLFDREQEIPGGQIRGKYPGNTPRSFTIPCMK